MFCQWLILETDSINVFDNISLTLLSRCFIVLYQEEIIFLANCLIVGFSLHLFCR